MQSCDIYLLPYTERIVTNSGTLSMAMAAGRVVVATPFEHAKEVVPGRGLLVEFDDSGAIERALAWLLADPQRMQALGQAAYELTHVLSWGNVAGQYMTLLDNLTLTHA